MPKRSTLLAALALAPFVLAACGGSEIATTRAVCATGCAPQPQSVLHIFSPAASLVAAYPSNISGHVEPTALLRGNQTELGQGHGFAVDSDGTMYVLAGSPPRVLVFAAGATGNVAPEATIELPSDLDGEYTLGLALDGHGNFWTGDVLGKRLLRFPVERGAVQPNLSIRPELNTPWGWIPASISEIVLDNAGNVYCECNDLINGAPIAGITEYGISAAGRARRIRGFYSPSAPETPPGAIAIGAKGEFYVAQHTNTLGMRGNAVLAYAAATRSGAAKVSRIIYSTKLEIATISTIATDASGRLYVAYQPVDLSSSAIAVFAPNASGDSTPLQVIHSPAFHFGPGEWGTLLAVH